MYEYFIIVAIFLTIFGIFYTFLTYRNRERLALIESGLDVEYFRSRIERQNIILLSFGLILIGFSAGVFCGFFFEKYLLEYYNPKGYRNYPQAYISMVTLFTGLAMLISYFVNRRLKGRPHPGT